MENMKNLLPIGLLISLVIIFFIKIIGMSSIFFEGDGRYIFYPIKLFYGECLKGFNFPSWLPYIQCGFPVFAVGNQGFLYPINLILFFYFPAYIAYNLNYIIHFLLVGTFTYFFAKVIGLPRISALISAIIFMFNGFFLGHLEHMDILNSVIWLPLILIFIEKIVRGEKTSIYVILSGIFIGIQILAGHQQMTFYSLLCMVLYFLFGVLYEQHKKILKYLLILVLIMIIGIGVSAVQIIPTWELLSNSNRAEGVSLKFANVGAFPPENFITFILPYFFGTMKNYWGKFNYSEGCVYVGILPLILFSFSFFLKKNRYVYFFALLAILSGILMVGSETPLYPLLWHLPVFNSIRAPARFAYLLTFSISILAGFGFSCLISKRIKIKGILRISYLLLILVLGSIILLNITGIEKFLPQGLSEQGIECLQEDIVSFFILITLSLIILIFWFKEKLGLINFKFLILLFIIIDASLFWFKGIPPTTKISKLSAISTPSTADFLVQDKKIYRILSVYPGRVNLFSKEKDPDVTLIKLLTPNFNLCSHIQHMNMILGLICVKDWLDVVKIFCKGTPETINQQEVIPLIIKNLPLLNLFNVKYILFTLDINDDRFRTVFEDNGVKIIENKEVLQRTFVVHNFKVIKEKEKVLEELGRREFNPRQYVILEKDPLLNTNSNPTASSTTKIINYRNEEVVIHCSMKDSGFLVLTDIYYPGWQVYIDNRKGKIYRAYHTFRAVYLEKGNHIVKFRYEPLSFKIGMWISLLTLCGIIIFFLYRERCMAIKAVARFDTFRF